MMRSILRILVLIAFYCTNVYAQVNIDSILYSEFKDKFTLAERTPINIESFFHTKTLNNSDPIGRYKALIPYGAIGVEEYGSYWQAGTRLEVGDFDVLHYRLWHSNPKTLYGPMWVDHLVAVYTQSGRLVDYCIILRLQDYYDGDIQGVIQPYRLNVKHVHTIGTEFERRLTFYRSYSISPLGKIEMSYIPAPAAIYSEIQKARPWPKCRLTNNFLYDYEDINPMEDKMSTLFSGYYMPISDNIHSWEWRWGIRHSTEHYTLLLSPASSDRLGTEVTGRKDIYVLTSMDKQGKVIDQRILGRNTPQERTFITSDKPEEIIIDSYILSFRDFYTLDDEAKHSRILYTIDSRGHISSKALTTDEPISSRQVP